MALAEVARKVADGAFGIVGVARLLITERPERRERRAPRQVCIFAQDLFGRTLQPTREDVIVQLAARRAERVARRVTLAHIEIGAIGVIEKQTVGFALFERDEEGD